MQNDPWGNPPSWQPAQPVFVFYPVGKRELVFGGVLLCFGWLLCNCLFYAGANLGFALAVVGCILCSVVYLQRSGFSLRGYTGALLLLSLVIAPGLARSDDGFVKFVNVCFLLVAVNLLLAQQSGKNRFAPGSVSCLLDVPRTALGFGLGKMPEVFRGLKQAFRRSGSVGRKGGAFLLGLCIAVPVLAVMIPLLISADAAFDGLMALLPEWEHEELLTTVIFGTGFSCLLFIRGVALKNVPQSTAAKATGKGISSITVNTVLGTVSLLYVVYLLSQLAYLSGGFSGILPEGYTLAQYARRGFFQMAVLSGGNLLLMVLALGVVKKECRAPLATRLLSLFIGLVTLFLIATASAKMFLYIGSYGLTRLRVLTQIVMLFLAVTTLVVMVWLFVPKLPYMKVVLLAALVIGAATLWTDVDTQVANYNVQAYLSGQLERVDVSYLCDLGSGAVPAIARLAEEAPVERIALQAETCLKEKRRQLSETDIRSWNYTDHVAKSYLPEE